MNQALHTAVRELRRHVTPEHAVLSFAAQQHVTPLQRLYGVHDLSGDVMFTASAFT